MKSYLVSFFSLLTFFHLHSSYAEIPPSLESSEYSAVLKWATERTQTAFAQFKSQNESYWRSPDFWGSQSIYQIQVDRFNNGDFSNDQLNLNETQSQAQKTNDLTNLPAFRHGGDLRGIIDRLDYLSDLGVTSLWITPVFKNNGSYHGYCETDFTEIDPGFGTQEDLRELVREAHLRGIRVILDIVINHICDPKTQYSYQADHARCAADLDQSNWNGTRAESSSQGGLGFSPQFFGPFKSQYFFNRCGANSTSDMQGSGASAIYGDFVATMFDFNTLNYDFQRLFTELHKYWIANADIDGYRLDAAKHVTEDFIAYFSTHIRQYARSLGKANFLVIGEVAGPSDWIARRLGQMSSDPIHPEQHGVVPATLTQRIFELKDIYLANPVARYPGLNAVYDFARGGTAVDILHNRRPPSDLEDYFQSSYYRDLKAQNDERLNWNLLEIHDWPRFASRNIHAQDKSILGTTYLALSQGSPVIYYGMEQGFNGDCHWDSMQAGSANSAIQQLCQSGSDALFRQDMFISGMFRLGSTVPEIDALASIGNSSLQRANPKQDPYLNRDHRLYRQTRYALHLRESCNALKFGTTQMRWVARENEGILAFTRKDPSGPEALVILNTAWSERTLPDEIGVSDSSKNRNWVNLYQPSQKATTSGRGSLLLHGLKIPPNGTAVFVPEEAAGPWNSYLGGSLCIS